ncbi:hypothetical protein ACTNBM_08290 [Lachnospiraceae bacterium HCP1S3_C3]
MEKLKKYSFWGIIIKLMIIFMLFATVICQWVPVNIAGLIKTIASVMVIWVFADIVIWGAIYIILVMRQGKHNIKKFDDEPFNIIDQYKNCLKEDNQYYKRQIQIINLYYKEDGKVDELVKNRQIEKLYVRADFLLNKISIFDNLMTCFSSLGISVIASFICQIMGYNNLLIVIVCTVVMLVCLFSIALSRYAEKGQAGSYLYYVNTYERELLLKKINKLEEELIINDDDEQALETKQAVINELIRIKNKKKLKKHKERLKADLKRVGELNLYIEDYSKSYKRKIYINGADAYLLYDLEKGKENNYIGELNLINQEYSILYQILSRYELISYSTDR